MLDTAEVFDVLNLYRDWEISVFPHLAERASPGQRPDPLRSHAFGHHWNPLGYPNVVGAMRLGGPKAEPFRQEDDGGRASSASRALSASSARTSRSAPARAGYMPPALSDRTIESMPASSSTPFATRASAVEGNVETMIRRATRHHSVRGALSFRAA